MPYMWVESMSSNAKVTGNLKSRRSRKKIDNSLRNKLQKSLRNKKKTTFNALEFMIDGHYGTYLSNFCLLLLTTTAASNFIHIRSTLSYGQQRLHIEMRPRNLRIWQNDDNVREKKSKSKKSINKSSIWRWRRRRKQTVDLWSVVCHNSNMKRALWRWSMGFFGV